MSVFLPVLRSMVTATAFQILVSNNAPIKAIVDNAIVTLEVRGVGGDKPLGSRVFRCHCWSLFQGVLPAAVEDAPTIVITAHYDSFGLAPVSHTTRDKTPCQDFFEMAFFAKSAPPPVFIYAGHSGFRTEPTRTAAASPSS